MNRKEKIEKIIEAQFENLDYRNLFNYFRQKQLEEYAGAVDEYIDSEYIEYFGPESNEPDNISYWSRTSKSSNYG